MCLLAIAFGVGNHTPYCLVQLIIRNNYYASIIKVLLITLFFVWMFLARLFSFNWIETPFLWFCWINGKVFSIRTQLFNLGLIGLVTITEVFFYWKNNLYTLSFNHSWWTRNIDLYTHMRNKTSCELTCVFQSDGPSHAQATAKVIAKVVAFIVSKTLISNNLKSLC